MLLVRIERIAVSYVVTLTTLLYLGAQSCCLGIMRQCPRNGSNSQAQPIRFQALKGNHGKVIDKAARFAPPNFCGIGQLHVVRWFTSPTSPTTIAFGLL